MWHAREITILRTSAIHSLHYHPTREWNLSGTVIYACFALNTCIRAFKRIALSPCVPLAYFKSFSWRGTCTQTALQAPYLNAMDKMLLQKLPSSLPWLSHTKVLYLTNQVSAGYA